MRAPGLWTTILLGGVTVTLAAQSVPQQDWKTMALQFPIIARMFFTIENDGYQMDLSNQTSRTLRNLFYLTAIPVLPPGKMRQPTTDSYFITPQPTGTIITSVIDPRRPTVVPTEVVIVYARLESTDMMALKGTLVESRDIVLEATLHISSGMLTVKRNETMLGKASRRLELDNACYDQVFKAEKEKCSGLLYPGCVAAAYLYADDQCRQFKNTAVGAPY
jgi:hypothetical protein